MPIKKHGRFASSYRFITGDDARGGYVRAEDLSTGSSHIIHRASWGECLGVARYLDNAPSAVKRAAFDAEDRTNNPSRTRRGAAHRKTTRVANPSRVIEVYAGAAGMVYEGTSMAKAREVYAATVADSKANRGPAAGESVALMVDGEPVKDYQGRNDR